MADKISEYVPNEVREFCADLEKYANRSGQKRLAPRFPLPPNSGDSAKESAPLIFSEFDRGVLKRLTCEQAGKPARTKALKDFWSGVKVSSTNISSERPKENPRLTVYVAYMTTYGELVLKLCEAYKFALKKKQFKEAISGDTKLNRLHDNIDSSVNYLKEVLQNLPEDWNVATILKTDPTAKEILFPQMYINPGLDQLPSVAQFLDLVAAHAQTELRVLRAASQTNRKRSDTHAFVKRVHRFMKVKYAREMDNVIASAALLLFDDDDYPVENVKGLRTKRKGTAKKGGWP